MRKSHIICILAIIVMYVSIRPIISQVDNPISAIGGAFKLSMTPDKVVEYNTSESYMEYISKTKDGSGYMIMLLEAEGWSFKDQTGSGYMFEKDGNTKVVSSTQWTRYFTLWKVPN